MSSVLVVAVHPDDETLGCGGTLLKHKAAGDRIHWLIATAMDEKRGYSRKAVLKREKEIGSVGDMYGFSTVHRLDIPTTSVDTLPFNELTKKINSVFNLVKPETIYLPFMKDAHSDHRIIFDAAYCCTKTFRCKYVKNIMMMETISETEFAPPVNEFVFAPNYFVDVTGFMKKKMAIMRVFESELGRHPFPRSLKNITALATKRGATAGCRYAEAFMILRRIW